MSDVRVYTINPIQDPRWRALLEQDPRASVFHDPRWLGALQQTYGYEPVVVTTCGPGQELTNGIVFCRVRSWLTGRRMVSVPFSDHCQPLVSDPQQLRQLMLWLARECDSGKWAYAELRPVEELSYDRASVEETQVFCLHRLDLSRSKEELFRGFHKNAVQMQIRRAERESLSYAAGRSESLLQQFYRLNVLTRRRRGLPSQPIAWFRNLSACMGDAFKIHVACKDARPVASIVTLRHKSTIIYKYGGSDRKFAKLGGTQLILWRAIEEAKRDGLLVLDMGRSDGNHKGLITFKDRWGATRSELTYLQYRKGRAFSPVVDAALHAARRFAPLATNVLSSVLGRALYRHLGCSLLPLIEFL
jgi:lipid II:glycine glycyltransferase (peptidoglycan interpeptide bridge formation enzyme)